MLRTPQRRKSAHDNHVGMICASFCPAGSRELHCRLAAGSACTHSGLLHKNNLLRQRGGCTDSGSRPVESAAPSGECARASTANMPTHLSPSGDHMCAPHQSNTPRSRKSSAALSLRASGPRVQREQGDARTQADIHTPSQHAVMRPPTHAPCCASACDAMGLAGLPAQRLLGAEGDDSLSLAHQPDPGARTPVWHRKGVWSRRGQRPPRPTVSRPSASRRAAAVRTVAGRDHRNGGLLCRASWSSTREPVALGMRGDVSVQDVGRRYSCAPACTRGPGVASTDAARVWGGLHGPAFDAEECHAHKAAGLPGAPGGGGWLFMTRGVCEEAQVVAIDLEDVVAEVPREELALGVSTGRIGTGGRSASNGGKGGGGVLQTHRWLGGVSWHRRPGRGERKCLLRLRPAPVWKPPSQCAVNATTRPSQILQGDEVQPDRTRGASNICLRVCVQTDGQGIGGAQEGGLQRMTPSLLELDVPDPGPLIPVARYRRPPSFFSHNDQQGQRRPNCRLHAGRI